MGILIRIRTLIFNPWKVKCIDRIDIDGDWVREWEQESKMQTHTHHYTFNLVLEIDCVCNIYFGNCIFLLFRNCSFLFISFIKSFL